MKQVLLVGNTKKGNFPISIIYDNDLIEKNRFTVTTRLCKIRTGKPETAAQIYATSTGSDVHDVITQLSQHIKVR